MIGKKFKIKIKQKNVNIRIFYLKAQLCSKFLIMKIKTFREAEFTFNFLLTRNIFNLFIHQPCLPLISNFLSFPVYF